MLRKLYYLLPPKMRFLVRRLIYFPYDVWSSNDGLKPPKSLIYTGSGDFIRQGIEWKNFFIEQGLQPNDHFLDIGSGIGRIAIGLTSYLKGDYQGFEAMEVGADWCKKNITPKYPNFSFKHVSLHNDLYNASGLDAATYKFEYPSASFHMACAISVFSHMIDNEVENYLSETFRVLKNGGKLIATFFVMDNDSLSLMSADYKGFRFDYEYEHYYLMDKNVKSANVCFKKDYLDSVIVKNGFTIQSAIRGSWFGIKNGNNLAFQDIYVLVK